MSYYPVSRRSNDEREFIVFNSSGASSFTLPDAYTCPGISFLFKNQGTGAATISTSQNQTIDGSSTYALASQYSEVGLFSDGKNWNVSIPSASGGGGGSYTLPAATNSVLGGVKQGANTTIAGDGTISVAAPTAAYTLPVATSSVLGGVKQGANTTIAGDGTISVAAPTAAYTLPVATNSVLGGVKQGANTTIAGDGTISVAAASVVMVASGSTHAAGLAPDPGSSAGTTRFLREDATWVAPSSSSSVGLGATLRNIATRCTIPGFTSTSNTSLFSRTAHINRSDATTGFQPVFANWYATYQGEFTGYASYVVSSALEYPAGTYTRLTFSGANSVTIPAGTNVVADACAVVVPEGARFWIRTLVNCPTGIFTVNGPAVDTNQQVSGDQNLASATAIATDYTVNAYVGSGAQTSMYPPVAILATSSKASVIAYGDSRLAGLKDAQGGTNGGYGGFGEITRGYDPYTAYCNVGCPTDTAAKFVTAHTLRAALKQYHTHVHIQYGINDLNAGTTAAALETSLVTICGYFTGMKISANTLSPQCTSTDAFATQANQTQFAAAAQRQLHNTWLRGTTHPFGIVFDISDIVEYHRSGNWLSPDVDPRIISPITFEGTHFSPWGYLFAQKSGAVDGRIYQMG
jgi:hypothetical protein